MRLIVVVQAFGLLQAIFILVAASDGLGKMGEDVSSINIEDIDKVQPKHQKTARPPNTNTSR